MADQTLQHRTKGGQSIHRALDLLRVVARNNERGAVLSRMANEVGLHVATAHRILSVLVKEGLVTHDPVSKLYHLGLELYNLGGAAHQFLVRDQYREAMERIAKETEDTVFLLIPSGNDALCIDRVEGKFPIRALIVNVGARRPLGIGAGSLALMAFLPPEESERILAANAFRYPHHRNLTSDDIREMVERFRPLGFTSIEGLFHDGVTSIGFPLFGHAGNVAAAVTVSAISQRMGPERREAIVRAVKEIVRAEAKCPPLPIRSQGCSRSRGGKGVARNARPSHKSRT